MELPANCGKLSSGNRIVILSMQKCLQRSFNNIVRRPGASACYALLTCRKEGCKSILENVFDERPGWRDATFVAQTEKHFSILLVYKFRK